MTAVHVTFRKPVFMGSRVRVFGTPRKDARVICLAIEAHVPSKPE